MSLNNIARYPYPVKYLDVPGNTRIAYMDEGAGPVTILFIHGLANYAASWGRNMDFLKQTHRCIAIDLPGNGYSDRNDHTYTMQYFAQVIKDFIDAAQLTNVVLAGHSMGGQIAMTTVLNYPETAEKLVLFAPAGLEVFTPLEKVMYYTSMHFLDYLSTEENSLRRVIEASFYKIPQQAYDMMNDLSALLRKDNLLKYKLMVENCVKSMLEEPVYDRLGNIKQDTLIVYGERDELIPNRFIHHYDVTKLAKTASERLPNAQYHVLKEAGHFVHWERADTINPMVAGFVTNKSAVV